MTSTSITYSCLLFATLAACTKPNPDLLVSEELGTEDSESGDGTDDAGTAELADMPHSEVCEAGESLPPDCSACLVQACCDELLACMADPDCGCLTECLAQGQGQLTCVLECGLAGNTELPTDDLDECATAACGQLCSPSGD